MGDMADDARDVADRLKAGMVEMLEKSGHRGCEYAHRVTYVPEYGAAMCGCGVFAVLDEPETPGREVGFRAGNAPYRAADPIASTLALIDPTELYTPDDVERHILDCLYRLETGALFERQSVQALYRAQDTFDRAYNQAFFESTETSEGKRKAGAMHLCAEQATALNEAKMVREAVKSTMHNLRSILSGYQSTARSVQASYQAGGSPGGVPERAF